LSGSRNQPAVKHRYAQAAAAVDELKAEPASQRALHHHDRRAVPRRLIRPFNDWPRDTRTKPHAHAYIEAHWHELRDGDVIDVEFILSETAAPKRSERETAPV
jgi:hypothetical protein